MSLVTPRKRPADPLLADSTDDDDDDDRPGFGGEAIDWQDHDLEIGPTPQKHGRVIGLFDHLSPPSRTRSLPAVAASQGLTRPPSSKRTAETAFKHEGTKTTTKSPLKTPSFLRRQVLIVDETNSTPRLLFPALPKRGLSTLINELRALEDDDEDEGMNVLREMESPFTLPSEQTNDNEVEEENEIVDEKVKWKKKGLKRSHRRVIMRPTTKKSLPDAAIYKKAAEEGEEGDDNDDSDEYINSADEAADEVAAQGIQQQAVPTGAPPAANKTKAPAKRPGGVSQNFKSLKLRNSGAKGGSRFGRSRLGGRR